MYIYKHIQLKWQVYVLQIISIQELKTRQWLHNWFRVIHNEFAFKAMEDLDSNQDWDVVFCI